MRIELTDFPRLSIEQAKPERSGPASGSFFDTLKSAIETTNTRVKESDKAALALAKGENGNIHETMIAMQKADIDLRILVAVANKLIEGYNQLNQLR